MRLQKTLTLLMLAIGLVFGLSAWAGDVRLRSPCIQQPGWSVAC
jgi:hypothetical protein